MTNSGAAPKCLACVVDPRKGINQHQWLVNKMVAAWRDADPDAEYKTVAQDVAIAFDKEFDPQVLKPVYKKGKFQGYETEEARAERCDGRPGRILRWAENHKAWINAQRNMAPALLRFQPQPPAKARRSRASSARDLYVRDHPGVGKDVFKLNQPDEWQRYEEASAREKAERASRVAAGEESDGDEDEEDEVEDAPTQHDLLARLRLSMRTAIDSWVEQTGAEIFVYMGKVREDGTSNRSLMSAGKRGRDHLAQRVVTQPLIKTLDDYVLDAGGLTPRPANASASGSATQEHAEPLPSATHESTRETDHLSGGPQPPQNVPQALPDVPVPSEGVLRVEHPTDGNEGGPQPPQDIAPPMHVAAQPQRNVPVPSEGGAVHAEDSAASRDNTENDISHPPGVEAPRAVVVSGAELSVDVVQFNDVARPGAEPQPLQDGSNDDPAMADERAEPSLGVDQLAGVAQPAPAEPPQLQDGFSEEPAAEDDGKSEKIPGDPIEPAQHDAHVPESATASDTLPHGDAEPEGQTKGPRAVKKGTSRRGRGRQTKSSGRRATLVAPEGEHRAPARGQKRGSPEDAEMPDEPSGRPKRAKKQDYASLHRKGK
ncbi:uncharacterized protein B0H18DRAFT_1119619 [Fomitopsis serialis]|uniref:uncharacterized protein n=1 Tax=Fomitopsis serialis TaxID=139415 RepID=UPI002008994B|nr:uncharacterized protein B0H18DRAFT_1119619 [Neoantrodia serialis]KAH9925194.1 hypothetical protein B0H18DRAFT_1119619 [Neoantrodia serialis]